METGQIIWIVVAVLVVLAIVAVATVLMRKRRVEKDRHHAAGLRDDARAKAGGLQDSNLRAREAEVEAERKRVDAERTRVEAERAEAQAAEARQGHLQENAQVEDQVRRADRVDPDVDHKASGYRPGADPAAGTSGDHPTDPATGPTTTGPATGQPARDDLPPDGGPTHRA